MSQPTKFGQIDRYYTGTSDLPSKGPLPPATTLSGTFSTNGTIVTGVNTKFSTELAGVEGWLYSQSLNEVRRFRGYDDDTHLTLMRPFTSNVSGDNVQVCFIRYTWITIDNAVPGASAGLVKERNFAAGEIETYQNDAGLEPITYDFSNNTISGALILLQH